MNAKQPAVRLRVTRMQDTLAKIGRFLRVASRVRRQTGKGIGAQLWEIAQLRLADSKLAAREYYDYRLYDDNRFSYSSKRQFVGARGARRLYASTNQQDWRRISDDKLIFQAVLTTLCLPLPKLYAIYYRRGRFFGDVPCLKDADSLADFLRNSIPYPFFCKPVRGSHGAGAVAVAALDRDLDQLILSNQERINVRQYIAGLTDNRTPRVRRYGYLFQEQLTPHPDILSICGDRLSSVRMIVLLCEEGPRLIRAVWKIPVGRNMTDNFRHGASGNLVGHINLETGTVERIVTGVGPDQTEIRAHPDTDLPLLGVTIPYWSRLVDVCSSGASAFPGLRWQSWDIAMCPDGPVILELNANADLDLTQHASGTGLDDETLRSCLSRLAS